MITRHQRENILKLHKEGLSVAKIAQNVEVATPTIYRWLKKDKVFYQSISKWDKSKLSKFLSQINKALRSNRRNSLKLYKELQKQGYKGSYSTLNRYINERKASALSKRKSTRRLETHPGEQAQVDWASCGKVKIEGIKRPLYCFLYVLSYSRMTYIEFALRQDIHTFENCHKNAFACLGIPKTILYDNTKTVVLGRDKETHEPIYNSAFAIFASYYGFIVSLCTPHCPQEKGKVERNVYYVRQNFLDGLEIDRLNFSLEALEKLNHQAKHWLKTVANIRIHANLKERPLDRWRKEKPHLILSEVVRPYDNSRIQIRNSTQSGYVYYQSNRYEVPIGFVRKKLYIHEINQRGFRRVEILYSNKVIAKHSLLSGRGQTAKLPEQNKHSIFKTTDLDKTKKKSLHKVTCDRVFNTVRPLSYYDALIPKTGDLYE